MNVLGKMVRRALPVLLAGAVFAACQSEMMDYYEEPDWIKGSIYEILEADGCYTQFLRGVDTCGYTSLLRGRSILTVMAPTDSSMVVYLKANYQADDISQLPAAEVKKLIGYHILYYAFDKSKLVNFRPKEGDGATEDQKDVNAGLYYKFRSRSQDAPEKTAPARMLLSTGEIVDTSGVEVDIYHLERFVPVFSYRMFDTKLIDAKRNYEYFFPDTEWTGQDGFNVSDASVIPQVDSWETIAKNGYIYKIDRVMRPLETIHTELAANSDYSLYLKLYDQYAYFAEDEELTSLYGGGTTTYWQRDYEGGAFSIPNIAREWPVSDYSAMTTLASVSNSVFAPTDAAFDEFYRSYWGDEGTGYPSEVCYDSVSSDAIGYLLSNSFYSGSLVFPDEITRGDIVNAYTKTVISFDVDAVPQANRKMCVNGALYGQSVLTPPAVFGSVSGPAYKYKGYSYFLKMLTTSGMLSTLTSDAVNFILLYPGNAQFEANQVWYDSETDKLKSGPVGSTTAGNLGSGEQAKYVNAHLISLTDAAEPLSGAGLKVYRTLSPDYKLYWYVKDGRITNSFKYNSLIHYAGNMESTLDSVYTDYAELTFRGAAWSNGHCYEYDTRNGQMLFQGSNTNAIYAKFMPMIYAHRHDEGTLFQGFVQVLLKAGMIDETADGTMNYMNENCLILVPTTDAVKSALVAGNFPYMSVAAGTQPDDADFWDKVEAPAEDTEERTNLQHYLLQYFVPESTSPLADYPYPGFLSESGYSDGVSDGAPSIADITVSPSKSVNITFYDGCNTVSGLCAQAGDGTPVPLLDTYDCLPFVFDDGGVQFLNGIFEDKWPK